MIEEKILQMGRKRMKWNLSAANLHCQHPLKKAEKDVGLSSDQLPSSSAAATVKGRCQPQNFYISNNKI